ncbi:RICIN domain-containing protein [Streptomyces sp. HU2014]|uniref:RICIN domain-containing protein n=1 Tax=Streptomyces sp. HU2014 TaxID=2939414 RepID=UPI00200E659C|nr:RICIN domain-containing protein [Streptomyces sp. HU2014]UQI44683.1 RICIN domain-containing protein [Streptomyces sp. HU2014]
MTGASAADAGVGGPAVEVTPGAERHWMRNFNSAQCLAVPGGSTQQGTGLIQWPCGDWQDHRWTIKRAFVSGGVAYYQVVNDKSGQCLAVPGGGKEAGTQVIQWPCGDFKDHYWGAESTNFGIRLRNWNSGQCLAVPGGSTTQGEKVIQWPCGNWHDQSWSYYNE